MNIPYEQLQHQFKTVLLKHGFQKNKATLCANIFAGNSRDGVHSHGLNRFPAFIQHIKEGLINIDTEPEAINREGAIENWLIAMSKTTCPSLRGTAITSGLLPRRGSSPPHGGILAIVLVTQIAMQPASAACQP